jgi:hypothetical protein
LKNPSGDDVDPRVLESVDESRRALLRKLVLGSAFVIPAVASFSMESLAANRTGVRNPNQTMDLSRKNKKAKPETFPTPGRSKR